MAKQTSITGCQWGVGEGQLSDSETGQAYPARVVVLQDPDGREVYMFPMPVDEAKKLGQVLQSDDPEAETDKINRASELTVARSEEDVKRTADGLKLFE